MSSSESELITAFREEMRAGFAEFTTEMRTGFASLKGEMHEGLTQVSNRLDRTNELLLDTRELIVETRTDSAKAYSDISSKLAGISNFLLLSEDSHRKNERRLDALESRLEILENEARKKRRL